MWKQAVLAYLKVIIIIIIIIIVVVVVVAVAVFQGLGLLACFGSEFMF
jgi:hypothetical protein